MRWLFFALLAAVLIGYHALYLIAEVAEVSPYVADAATSGVERFLLYVVICGIILSQALSVSLRAAILFIAIYGILESGMVSVCQSLYVFSSENNSSGKDACDLLTGAPIGLIVASLSFALFVAFIAGFVHRSKLPSVPYTNPGVFVGFDRSARSSWKVLAALVTAPYSGCVYFRDGLGYRFDRASRCLIADPSLHWQDYKLRPYTGNHDLIRHGLPWSLNHNCAILK